MEQLYQTLQTKEIMHDNAKEGLYDMFLIFFKINSSRDLF
jgi:hypothetical protein